MSLEFVSVDVQPGQVFAGAHYLLSVRLSDSLGGMLPLRDRDENALLDRNGRFLFVGGE